jgi:hypothetical protein
VDSSSIKEGEEVSLKCICIAYPAPEITLILKFCKKFKSWPECEAKMIISVSKYFFRHD